jgi:hypothetical protein
MAFAEAVIALLGIALILGGGITALRATAIQAARARGAQGFSGWAQGRERVYRVELRLLGIACASTGAFLLWVLVESRP